MSEVGLTETVKGDGRTFEIWLTGRSEVYTIQATSAEQKSSWVDQIKSLLLHQLTQLKIKQHTTKQKYVYFVSIKVECQITNKFLCL